MFGQFVWALFGYGAGRLRRTGRFGVVRCGRGSAVGEWPIYVFIEFEIKNFCHLSMVFESKVRGFYSSSASKLIEKFKFLVWIQCSNSNSEVSKSSSSIRSSTFRLNQIWRIDAELVAARPESMGRVDGEQRTDRMNHYGTMCIRYFTSLNICPL